MIKKKLFVITFIFITGSMLVINSCYTDYGLTTSDFDVVTTLFDKSADFSKYTTYTLLDTVMRITDDEDDLENVDTKYDAQILSDIDRNLKNYGYQEIPAEEVDSTNLPDVVILVSAVSSTNYAGYTYWPGWWGGWGYWPGWGYYPGYGPGWGGYYPWYGGTVVSYTTGSLFIEYLDPADIDVENRRANIKWVGSLNGLLEDKSSNISRRIKEGIDQAFKQSPYLNLNAR